MIVILTLNTFTMSSPPPTWVTALGLVVVAALWGCTNPLLNKSSQGMEEGHPRDQPASQQHNSTSPSTSNMPSDRAASRGLFQRLLSDTLYLVGNWKVSRTAMHR